MALMHFLHEPPPQQVLLPLHFDVQGHYLQTSTLISGLQAVEDVVQGLNKFHFNGKLPIKVISLPSEEGGYLANIAFVVGIGLSLVEIAKELIDIHESDTFRVAVEEFTGEPYVHEEVTRNLSGAFRDSVGGFFLINNEKIRQLCDDSPLLDKAIKSKSRFMLQCINDSDVRGLGFSASHDFRITGDDFWKHISDVRERIKPIEVLHLRGFVASSVVLEGTERQWAIRVTHSGQNRVKKPYEISAYLVDEDFAADLFDGRHPVREDAQPDAIEVEVLVSQVTRDGKMVNKSMKQITKVISFKGERLVADDYEIGSASELFPEQDDLFSFKPDADD